MSVLPFFLPSPRPSVRSTVCLRGFSATSVAIGRKIGTPAEFGLFCWRMSFFSVFFLISSLSSSCVLCGFNDSPTIQYIMSLVFIYYQILKIHFKTIIPAKKCLKAKICVHSEERNFHYPHQPHPLLRSFSACLSLCLSSSLTHPPTGSHLTPILSPPPLFLLLLSSPTHPQ